MTPPPPHLPAALPPDLVCLSHLRWHWVYQRPQHLMTRAARHRRVFVVEEPREHAGPPRLQVEQVAENLLVFTPECPPGLPAAECEALQRALLDDVRAEHGIEDFALWYYTPMALPFAGHLAPAVTIYDCMDELSGFAGASPRLRTLEAELLRRADLVFTGGLSLYEAKRDLHPEVHAFPSSVDVAHFADARRPRPDPQDQAGIPHPRLGFYGVLDERLDLGLLAELAARRPDWQLVLVGPVAKIAPDALPQGPNLHYLGPKRYDDLPAYLAGWDVALMPFALNAATRFISPTKTPEFLAAGLPVVSTPVRDVVRSWGEPGLARIAATAAEMEAAVEAALVEAAGPRQARADRCLAELSWDRTWARMDQLITSALTRTAARTRCSTT